MNNKTTPQNANGEEASTKLIGDEKQVNNSEDDCYQGQNDAVCYFGKISFDIDSENFLDQSYQFSSKDQNDQNDYEVQSTHQNQQEFNFFLNGESFNDFLSQQPRTLRLNTTNVDLKVPGETKNLPKGYARALVCFINSVLQDSAQNQQMAQLGQNQTLRAFLKQNPEEIGKNKFTEFLNTDVGALFAQYFFGNCKWSYTLTKENKTQVETYFRYNITYFEEVIHPKRKQVKI